MSFINKHKYVFAAPILFILCIYLIESICFIGIAFLAFFDFIITPLSWPAYLVSSFLTYVVVRFVFYQIHQRIPFLISHLFLLFLLCSFSIFVLSFLIYVVRAELFLLCPSHWSVFELAGFGYSGKITCALSILFTLFFVFRFKRKSHQTIA
ncbi:MAG: hypothetical protein AAF487_15230, partial [Bacteroidota bacterium]